MFDKFCDYQYFVTVNTDELRTTKHFNLYIVSIYNCFDNNWSFIGLFNRVWHIYHVCLLGTKLF